VSLTIEVECNPCRICKRSGLLQDVDVEGYLAWQAGTPIQEALPMLDADQRELLVTGTHPHCWLRLWGGRL
jgi:hypothetical protein